jgi:hypothetical protein
MAPQRPNSEKIEMDFEELERLVQEKEAESRKLIISSLQEAAKSIDLELLLSIVEHETIFSNHPRINRAGDELRIGILHMPHLRGKYFVLMEESKLGLFREGYDDPLVKYDEERVKVTYNYIKKYFWD